MKWKILLVVLLAASIYINYRQFTGAKSDSSSLEALQKNTTNGNANIVYKYIHDSIPHTVIKEVHVASKAEKVYAVGSGYIDTLTKALSIAQDKMSEATKIQARLEAENVRLKKIAANAYQYRDKWLALDYNTDSNSVNLKYDVSLNIVKYHKRKWLIGAKEHYIDIFSDDPRVNVNNVKRFSVAERRQKRFGIGINAGYSYSPWLNTLTPTIGVGLNYNLIEF